MAMMKAMCVVLVLALMFAPPAAALGCNVVIQYLGSCYPYVMGQGGLGGCCGGVRGLYSVARSTPDRQSICNCLERLARSVRVNMGKAASLPRVCGVNIGYQISPSTDCSRVR